MERALRVIVAEVVAAADLVFKVRVIQRGVAHAALVRVVVERDAHLVVGQLQRAGDLQVLGVALRHGGAAAELCKAVCGHDILPGAAKLRHSAGAEGVHAVQRTGLGRAVYIHLVAGRQRPDGAQAERKSSRERGRQYILPIFPCLHTSTFGCFHFDDLLTESALGDNISRKPDASSAIDKFTSIIVADGRNCKHGLYRHYSAHIRILLSYGERKVLQWKNLK